MPAWLQRRLERERLRAGGDGQKKQLCALVVKTTYMTIYGLMNTPLYIRYKHALDNFFKEVKAVVGFEIWFSLIFAAVLAPLSAWLLNKLLVTGGQLAVSNDEIIGFFLSFRGVLFILISITFFIGLTYLEQVGLMMISLASLKGAGNLSQQRSMGGSCPFCLYH